MCCFILQKRIVIVMLIPRQSDHLGVCVEAPVVVEGEVTIMHHGVKQLEEFGLRQVYR